MMGDFLDSRKGEIANRIERLLGDADEICCIVAFWGRGAFELFDGIGKKKVKEIRIVCNLTMGGTNPWVIQDLHKKGLQIRHNTTLHSKVYWTDKGVVVGSANASANGLSLEFGEQSGWLEAAIYLNCPKEIKAVRKYVNEIWNASKCITSEDFTEAKIRWKSRRPFSSPDSTLGFVDALRQGRFTNREKDIYVAVDVNPAEEWQDDIDAQSRELKEYNFEFRDKTLGAWVWPNNAEIEIPEDAYAIDYFCDHDNNVSFEYIWKTLPQKYYQEGLEEMTYQYAFAIEENEIGMTRAQRRQMTAIIQYIVIHHPQLLAHDLHSNGCYISIESLLLPNIAEIIDECLQSTPAARPNRTFSHFFGDDAVSRFWATLSQMEVFREDAGVQLNLEEVQVDPRMLIQALNVLIEDGEGVVQSEKADHFPEESRERFTNSPWGGVHAALFRLAADFPNVWIQGKKSYGVRVSHTRHPGG